MVRCIGCLGTAAPPEFYVTAEDTLVPFDYSLPSVPAFSLRDSFERALVCFRSGEALLLIFLSAKSKHCYLEWMYDLDHLFLMFIDRGGAAWQPMGVTGVNDGVGVNDLSITDLSEGARTPSR